MCIEMDVVRAQKITSMEIKMLECRFMVEDAPKSYETEFSITDALEYMFLIAQASHYNKMKYHTMAIVVLKL